jgi:hypothetical protein
LSCLSTALVDLRFGFEFKIMLGGGGGDKATGESSLEGFEILNKF